MSTFAPLQHKRVRTASPVRQSAPALRSSRALEAPKVSAASETESSPERQFTAHFSLAHIPIIPPKTNQTGLPDNLKNRIESFSGYVLDDVRIHYNSPEPARLGAWAYTQGTNIYVGPGQERHLPHEAWHVVQQKQGRVMPTIYVNGLAMNDNHWLENEADSLGARAVAGQFSHGALSRFTGVTIQRPGYLVDATPRAKQGVVQCNGDGPPPHLWPPGLRRRRPAPARQRELAGPPVRAELDRNLILARVRLLMTARLRAYLLDMQNRPGIYAKKGFTWTFSLILGHLGLHIPRAMFNLITGFPALANQFKRMLSEFTSGNQRNAAADAASLASSIAGIIEIALGTEGMIAYATTAGVYGPALARVKEKTE